MTPAALHRSLRRLAESARRAKLKLAEPHAFPPTLRSDRRGRHVIVIGGGLSGLSAACLLRSAGQQVTVLEARLRPGGRVLTLREPFTEGLDADAGAGRISDDHRWTLAWARHFGLELEPMYPSAGRLVGERDGRRLAGADTARLSSHHINQLLVGVSTSLSQRRFRRGLTFPQGERFRLGATWMVVSRSANWRAGPE